MTLPKLTVCMPVFDAARYLRAAVESVLEQSFTDFEFLILDDGSTDGSLDIARRYATRDERVLVMSYAHGGYARLLNIGLAHARGALFARMDADDTAHRLRFHLQVEYMERHPDCIGAGTQLLMVDPDGDPINRTMYPLTHQEIEAGNLAGRYSMGHPSLVIRSATLRSAGGYHPELEPAEDFDLLLRLGELGQLANLPEILYYYRMHPHQVTVRKYETQQRGLREAMRQACLRRGLPEPSRPPTIHRRPERPWQVHVTWSELAARAGHRSSAVKHGRKAVALRPWSRTAWKVLWMAARR